VSAPLLPGVKAVDVAQRKLFKACSHGTSSVNFQSALEQDQTGECGAAFGGETSPTPLKLDRSEGGVRHAGFRDANERSTQIAKRADMEHELNARCTVVFEPAGNRIFVFEAKMNSTTGPQFQPDEKVEPASKTKSPRHSLALTGDDCGDLRDRRAESGETATSGTGHQFAMDDRCPQTRLIGDADRPIRSLFQAIGLDGDKANSDLPDFSLAGRPFSSAPAKGSLHANPISADITISISSPKTGEVLIKFAADDEKIGICVHVAKEGVRRKLERDNLAIVDMLRAENIDVSYLRILNLEDFSVRKNLKKGPGRPILGTEKASGIFIPSNFQYQSRRQCLKACDLLLSFFNAYI
jgi:hypothetical protein